MTGALWKIAKRLAMPLVAAILLLVLFEIHSAIIRTALTHVGLRPDVPVIIASRDDCGKLTTYIGARSVDGRNVEGDRGVDERSGGRPDDGCSRLARIYVAAQRDTPTTLFVNFERIETAVGSGRLVQFRPVDLRPGRNVVFAVGPDKSLWMPYGTAGMPASDTDGQSYRVSRVFGRVPIVEDTARAHIHGPPVAETGGLLGVWSTPGGDRQALFAFDPASANPFDVMGDIERNGVINDRNGLLLAKLADGNALAGTGPPDIQRHLSATRRPDGTVAVTARACLPDQHPILDRARQGGVLASELLATVFGTQVGRWATVHQSVAFSNPAVRVERDGSLQCSNLLLDTELAGAELVVSGYGEVSFPNLPGDRLVLTGFASRVEIVGRQPDEVGKETRVWRGRSLGETDGTVVIWPNWSMAAERSVGRISGDFPPGRDVAPPRSKSFLADVHKLLDLVPYQINWVLRGLATIAPVALILWTLRRYGADEDVRKTSFRLLAGLSGILVFGAVFSFQPLVTELTRGLLEFSEIAILMEEPGAGRIAGSGLAVPIAFIVVVLVVPLLREGAREGDRHSGRVIKVGAAATSLLLCAAGTLVLWMEFLAFDKRQQFDAAVGTWVATLAGEVAAYGDPGYEIAVFVFLWLCLVALLAWIPVWFVIDAVSRADRIFGASVWAAAIIFFLPLVAPALDLYAQLTTIADMSAADNWWRFEQSPLTRALDWVAGIAPHLVLLVLVFLTLRALREIVLVLLPVRWVSRVGRAASPVALVVASFVIVASLDGLAGDGGDDAILLVMGVFQACAPALALLGVYTLLERIDAERTKSGNDPFALPEGAYMVCAAAFAGYLTVWDRNPLGAVILMGTGWIVFTRLLLSGSEASSDLRSDPALAGRLLRFRSELRLLGQMRTALEKSLVGGQIDRAGFDDKRREIDRSEAEARAELDEEPGEAKRRILELGPRSTPFRNGLLGGSLGLVVAFIIQLFSSVVPGGGEEEAGGSALANVFQLIFTDPSYSLVALTMQAPRLLAVLAGLINAVSLWVIAGFLFGYVFHRVRGDDGFVKALTFSVGIAVAFLLSQTLVGATVTTPVDAVTRFVPVFAFLMILGTFVFDGMSLARQNVAVSSLPEIYGVRTSVGYASFAGALAAAQPILGLADWVSGLAG